MKKHQFCTKCEFHIYDEPVKAQMKLDEHKKVCNKENKYIDIYKIFTSCCKEGYKPTEFVLNYAPTQFTVGKTSKAMNDIIKRSEMKNINSEEVYHCTIVFSRNSIEETRQWTTRIKSQQIVAIQFSSKSSDIDSRAELMALFTETTDKKKLPSCILMCNHPKRINDIIYLLDLFTQSLTLRPQTGYKYPKFDIIFDEAALGITNIDKLFTNIPNLLSEVTKDLPCIVEQVMCITATPDDKNFIKLLNGVGINKIKKLNNEKYNEVELEKLRDAYMSISRHEKIYYDNLTKDPVEYVETYLGNIKGKCNIIFAPSTFKTKGHERMASMFVSEDYICLIHNGTNKEFRFPNGTIITLKDFRKKHNIKGELRDLLRKFRIEFPTQNIAITGKNTIGTGMTWNTDGFNFTHLFLSMYHARDASDLRQLFGRATGHEDYVEKCTVIVPEKVMIAYNIRLNNVKEIMNRTENEVLIESLRNTHNAELMAYNVPIVINVKPIDMDILKTLKKGIKKDMVCKLVKGDIPIGYDRSCLIYITQPKSDNSYKKHITDYVKKIESSTPSGLIDIDFKSKKYKDYYYKKFWISFIDTRENRLVILRWNGTKLDK
jgi:hypothetical protein